MESDSGSMEGEDIEERISPVPCRSSSRHLDPLYVPVVAYLNTNARVRLVDTDTFAARMCKDLWTHFLSTFGHNLQK